MTSFLFSSTIVSLFLFLSFYSQTFREFSCLLTPFLAPWLFWGALILPVLALKLPSFLSGKNFEKRFRLFLPGLVLILFLLPLFEQWCGKSSSEIANYSSIGGLIPWSDAAGYFQGAEQILFDGKLDDWNSRRPLNALFLAAHLGLCNNDLQWSLILQTLLLGLACYHLMFEVQKYYGWRASLLSLGILQGFGRQYVGATLSEAVGLTLGALALTSFLRFFQSQKLFHLFWGFLLFTIALNTRAGAFFMLPTLFLWVLWSSPRGFLKELFKRGALSFLAIALGFAFNPLLINLYHGNSAGGHANFAPTFYGIASGGIGWKAAYDEFPQLSNMSTASQTAFFFEKSWEKISREPQLLVRGIASNLVYSIFGFGWQFSLSFAYPFPFDATTVNLSSRTKALFATLFYAFIFLAFIRNHSRIRWEDLGFHLASLGGFLLSLPIIYPDGQLRVTAVSLPFIGLLTALPFGEKPQEGAFQVDSSSSSIPLGLAIILSGILLPAAFHQYYSGQLVDRGSNEANQTIVTNISQQNQIQIVFNSESLSTFAPLVKRETIAKNPLSVMEDPQGLATLLASPCRLLFGVDYQRIPSVGRTVLLIIPENKGALQSSQAKLSITRTPGSPYFFQSFEEQ